MLNGCSMTVIVSACVIIPTFSYSALIISYSLSILSTSSTSPISIISPSISIVHKPNTNTIIIYKVDFLTNDIGYY